jgi:hypothetical protein
MRGGAAFNDENLTAFARRSRPLRHQWTLHARHEEVRVQYLIWPRARDASSPVGPVVDARSGEEAIRIALEQSKDMFVSQLGYVPDPSELVAEALETP